MHAILDVAWAECVRTQYDVDLILKMVALVALMVLAVDPSAGPIAKCSSIIVALWSFLTAMATRDFLTELGEIAGTMAHFHTLDAYLGSLQNIWDWAIIALNVYFMWSLPSREDGLQSVHGRKLLAAICAVKWVQLLLKVGAYRLGNMGFKIISIFKSFFAITSITFITTFLFMGFVHGFLALYQPGVDNINLVLVSAFRLLFLGDGDGVDFVLSLGDENSDSDVWMSTVICFFCAVIFCICVLNLFIAVHSEAYNEVSAKAKEHFYHRRAQICLKGMLLPRLNCGTVTSPLGLYCLILTIGVTVWALMLIVGSVQLSLMV